MKSIAAFVLLTAFASSAFGYTRNAEIYNCDNPSGIDVIDLACNIYFEARNEPRIGQYAVAHTVMNRVESPHYPDTPSAVSYEIRVDARTGKRVAMYSWRLDGKRDRIYNYKAWATALEIAVDVIAGRLARTMTDITFGSMWYHSTLIDLPYWANPETPRAYFPSVRIGRHQFYVATEATLYVNMLRIQN